MIKKALLCATFIFSSSALANPVPMETSDICKAKVEGRSLNSVEQLVRLTNHWINNQVDSEKVKQLTDFLNQNPRPANPFENGFERGDVQLNVVFQLLLNKITDQDWSEYVKAMTDLLDTNQQQREKIAHIDHEESLSVFEILHFAPIAVQDPRNDNPPTIVTLKNQKSYAIIDVNTLIDDKKMETQIYFVDQETLQLDLVGQLNISNLLPAHIGLDRVYSIEFISTPTPIDEQRFLANIEIHYSNDIGTYKTPLRVFAEINVLTGETHLLSNLINSFPAKDSKPLVISEEEIYFSNFIEENGITSKVSFLKLNLVTREIKELRKSHSRDKFPVHIIQNENGDILWIKTTSSKFEVYTLKHSTGELLLDTTDSMHSGIDSYTSPVFFRTSSGQWIASIVSSGKLSFYTFDLDTLEFKLLGGYSDSNYSESRQTIFESSSGEIYLAMGSGTSTSPGIILLKVDPINELVQLVTSYETKTEVSEEIIISQGQDNRIFLTCVDDLRNLLLLEFEESSETIIPLQEHRLSSASSIGHFVTKGPSVFLPVTHQKSELHVHQVSIGKKK